MTALTQANAVAADVWCQRDQEGRSFTFTCPVNVPDTRTSFTCPIFWVLLHLQ